MAALGVLSLMCGLVGGFGPLVRWQVNRVGETYGAAILVDRVRPDWYGVVLRGVDVRLREVPSIAVRLDEVSVRLGASERDLTLRGGTVSAVGPRERLLRELEAWRAARPMRAALTARSSSGSLVRVEGLKVLWQDRADSPSESLSATGVRISRAGMKTSVEADDAVLSSGRARLSTRGGRLLLVHGDEGYRVAELASAAVDAELALPEPLPEAQVAAAETADAKSATHVAQAQHPRERVDDDASRAEGANPTFREALLRGAYALNAALADGAKVDVAEVTARLHLRGDKLNLGPGNLNVRRESHALVVELSPGEPAGAVGSDPQHTLTFRLEVPLGGPSETARDVVADIRGGPIWLSTLGVREGDMGLFDVARASIVSRARITLSGDGQTVGLDGEGRLKNLSLRSASLADEPVAGLDLAWRAKIEGKLDGSRLAVEEGEVDLGSLRLIGAGEYQRSGDAHRVRGEFEVPLTACQAMLDSAPRGVVAKLAGMRLAGSFGMKGKLRFDTANLDRGFQFDWGVSNTCRVTEVPPELHVDQFKRPFRRLVYGPGGQRVEIESGPGTTDWVPYDEISRFMEVAVLTTEDGGFLRHHGFDEEAIKNSIRENLRKRRFVRGASTISMQLAKNIYLERTKSIARKLQEALLTMYLEQELTKEQIMELYLNVVEFGPMVYGIGAAAQHYFNASAAQLSLGQALYISSILPNPKTQHFEPGGAVTAAWSEYLHKLMRIAQRRGRITEQELEAGLLESVVRGAPAPHLAPQPRAAELGGPPDDDGSWVAP